MLSIYFGDMPQAIYNTPTYFNNVYLDSWLEDTLDQKMIKAVDKGEVCGPNAVETKALGLIPPTKLSGGVKTLMLIHISRIKFSMRPTAAITVPAGF